MPEVVSSYYAAYAQVLTDHIVQPPIKDNPTEPNVGQVQAKPKAHPPVFEVKKPAPKVPASAPKEPKKMKCERERRERERERELREEKLLKEKLESTHLPMLMPKLGEKLGKHCDPTCK
jgi:hypothetical protein